MDLITGNGEIIEVTEMEYLILLEEGLIGSREDDSIFLDMDVTDPGNACWLSELIGY